VGGAIRIGLMLTLALSWPAWRVIGYDVVINGPGEVASLVSGASGLPGTNHSLVARLQNVDDGIVAMTQFGTGRLTGGVVGNSDRGDSFHGIAMADETGFGWGRVLFLISALGPYGITHIGGGILLALAPLMAGLMLFAQTMGLFVGWVRGLVFASLGSLVLTLAQGVELSVLTPWANDILSIREANTFTPSAPTELLALTLAFCFLNFGLLALVARVSFMPHAVLTQWLQPVGQDLVARFSGGARQILSSSHLPALTKVTRAR
jgi:type IV secretion system protein VirB6